MIYKFCTFIWVFMSFLQQDLDVDPKEANKGTPEETGSYLVSKDLPKHCLYTRLSSLQKLKVNINCFLQ